MTSTLYEKALFVIQIMQRIRNYHSTSFFNFLKNSFYCTKCKIHHSAIVMKVLCNAQTLSLECFQLLKMHTNVSHIVICIIKLAPKQIFEYEA